MREIRFRGKRVNGNSWVYGYLYQHFSVNPIHQTCVIFDDAGRDIPFSGRYDVIPESIGQYTGLKDKNGKELYTGDICKFYECLDEDLFFHGIAKVIHSGIGWEWEIVKQENIIIDSSSFWNDDFEVIGDVYQNPELLDEN